MKTSISKLTMSMLALLLIITAVLLFSIPKSILVDRLLMNRGIYIIPERVEEGLFTIDFEGLKVFYGNRKLGEFSRVRTSVKPMAMELSAVCGSGKIRAVFGLRNLKLDLHSADCFEGIGAVSGKLDLRERELKGNLLVRDLLVNGLKIDSLKLTFKGSSFEGEMEYLGMKLVGGGTFKLDLPNVETSEINGEFKGSVGRLIVKGELKNITAQLR